MKLTTLSGATTDGLIRPIIGGLELPERFKAEYSSLNLEDHSFIIFKRRAYPLCDFLRFNTVWTVPSPYGPDWHAYHADSYGAGIIIHIMPDGESVVVGQYNS